MRVAEMVGTRSQWEEALGLPHPELAKRAIRGDPVARHVATMSLRERWFEFGGIDDDPPLDIMLADLRRQRRRATLRGAK